MVLTDELYVLRINVGVLQILLWLETLSFQLLVGKVLILLFSSTYDFQLELQAILNGKLLILFPVLK